MKSVSIYELERRNRLVVNVDRRRDWSEGILNLIPHKLE